VWLGGRPSSDRIRRIQKKGDKHLVYLRVPVSELLPSMHVGWQHVLWDDQIPNPATRGKPVLEPVTEESKLASWDSIFDIHPSADLSELQGVMDRIEPEWVDSIQNLVTIHGPK
jgi:hypothetical protein